jgi:uncharacterized protein (TIGR03000 family)
MGCNQTSGQAARLIESRIRGEPPMRYLSMTPTKGLLLASLVLLFFADTASAQRRSRGRNPYYYSYPLTFDAYQQPLNNDFYVYPPTTYRANYPPNYSSLPATIELVVPADAQVWFNGQATAQTGSVRRFVTPPLNANGDYSYEVKVRWTRNREPVEETRNIPVVAGAFRRLDLLQQR